jgi:hypothetical protein
LYTARELILSRVVFVDVVALRVSLFSAVVALLGGFAKVLVRDQDSQSYKIAKHACYLPTHNNHSNTPTL